MSSPNIHTVNANWNRKPTWTDCVGICSAKAMLLWSKLSSIATNAPCTPDSIKWLAYSLRPTDWVHLITRSLLHTSTSANQQMAAPVSKSLPSSHGTLRVKERTLAARQNYGYALNLRRITPVIKFINQRDATSYLPLLSLMDSSRLLANSPLSKLSLLRQLMPYCKLVLSQKGTEN